LVHRTLYLFKLLLVDSLLSGNSPLLLDLIIFVHLCTLQVVEHLMPQPLQFLGASVLGGLQPRELLVSTPNWDYNSTMQAAIRSKLAAAAASLAASAPKGGDETWAAVETCAEWPGPPGRDGLPLRCGDHK
jgi:syndecan 1